MFHTDLRIFREAQRWDELGQHNETDILSGPHAAKGILRWRQAEEASQVDWVNRKMPLDTSQLEEEIVFVLAESWFRALLPMQSIHQSR